MKEGWCRVVGVLPVLDRVITGQECRDGSAVVGGGVAVGLFSGGVGTVQ